MLPETVIAVFATLEIPINDLSDCTDLREDLGMDSQELVEMIALLEETHGRTAGTHTSRFKDFVLLSDVVKFSNDLAERKIA
ncbi:acyl carrier protein [Paenarthrobacter sp. NPDC089675]|uniref:acyl carrier protein n=1 Tax=Paenarthrobacter sp. NPDC089675 TaxID=3364376 RepID=UPI00380D6CE8